jgi:hypothetical protein
MSYITFDRMSVAEESLHVTAAMIHGIAGDIRYRIPKLALDMRQQSQGLMEAHQALLQDSQLPRLL